MACKCCEKDCWEVTLWEVMVDPWGGVINVYVWLHNPATGRSTLWMLVFVFSDTTFYNAGYEISDGITGYYQIDMTPNFLSIAIQLAAPCCGRDGIYGTISLSLGMALEENFIQNSIASSTFFTCM